MYIKIKYYLCFKLIKKNDLKPMIGVYITSDNALMDEDDLIGWLLFEISNNAYKKRYSFDELTGGVCYFTSKSCYEKVKQRFENTLEFEE